jgi:hypothetical protein
MTLLLAPYMDSSVLQAFLFDRNDQSTQLLLYSRLIDEVLLPLALVLQVAKIGNILPLVIHVIKIT